MKLYLAVLTLCATLVAQSATRGAIAASSSAASDLANKGVMVSFKATPPSASFTKFHWEFGDYAEMTSELANPSHRYTRPGLYTVHLRMSDASGASQASAEIRVKINPPVEIDPQ